MAENNSKEHEELIERSVRMIESNGLRIPKGVCICVLDDGELGFIKTGELDPDEWERFKLDWFFCGFPTGDGSNITRERCTGEYVKF